MPVRRPHLGFLVAAALFLMAPSVRADTYDSRTLVAVTARGPSDTELLYACNFDIAGRRGDVYKVLLTPAQLDLLLAKGLRIEILYDEMAEDRRLWREADEAPRVPGAAAYYTASRFNTVNPPAGSLMEHLLQLYNAHPDVCRLYNLGATQDGAYDIVTMKVSKNPDAVEAEPKIRIYANIHGDEKGAEMVACDVLDTILAGYAAVPRDATARKLVDESEMWFIPMGNPWGNANSSRYNSRTVDLNRNFWGPAGSDAPPAWSEAETQAIRDLTEAATAWHGKKRFTTSLSFHGGATCFNSVWNYAHAEPGDEPIFWTSRTGGTGCGAQTYCPTIAPYGLAKAYQDGCTTAGFWFTEGYDWYGTRGDTNDWAYGQWTDLDTTIEVTAQKTPPVSSIPVFCAEHRQAVLNYMLKTFQGIHGVMTDQATGAPLDGTVAVTATASASGPVPRDYPAVYTDPAAGDFHRVLQPGTYTVRCSAPGYPATVIPGVVVAADAGTVANCAMCRTGLAYGGSSFADACSGTGAGGGDGWLDAGEDAVVQVTLSNPGSVAATGVSAALGTTTPGITVTRAVAVFSDVPGGGSATSAAPHFALSVGTGVPCGTTVALSLHMTSAQGAWDDGFTLVTGQVTPGSSQALFAETFDGAAFPPSGWAKAAVSGLQGDWTRATATIHPAGGSPHGGAGMAAFNSFTAPGANSTRLYRTAAAAIPASAGSATFTFWMYHDAGYASGDAVQAQVSAGGGAWTDAGAAVPRYDGSTGWKSHAVDLSAFAGQSVQVGLLGVSAYGNDCYVDDVSLAYTQAPACVQQACIPALLPPGETAPGATPAAAQSWSGTGVHVWPANPQAASYRLYRGLRADLPALLTSGPDSCLSYSGTATSAAAAADPAGVPGGFYWYLVTGVNGGGEGDAGSATAGARFVNSSGACP